MKVIYNDMKNNIDEKLKIKMFLEAITIAAEEYLIPGKYFFHDKLTLMTIPLV